MTNPGLVRELFDGPIDVVGDVHGEIRALHALREKLGYDETGHHHEGRRLVFLGDLGDRGEDSPAVVEWVRDRVAEGRAQAVLGNHDFNALDAASGGRMRTELSWLFDEARPYSHHGTPVPQKHARGQRRDDVLAFFATLPVALERTGELPVRVVQASWEQGLVERLRHRTDVMAASREEKQIIQSALDVAGETDRLIRKLLHQNCNAVKRLTSGLEGRLTDPIYINDEPRWEGRLPWWNGYKDDVLCVIGHYWRIGLPDEKPFEHLFPDQRPNALHGSGPVMCIDYSVGKRFRERIGGWRWHTRLAGLRLPEQRLVFDDGEGMELLRQTAPSAAAPG